MLEAIHAVYPEIHIKAFTAVEIVHLARISKRGRDVAGVLADLKAAGLAILVIDKNVAALARIADRHTIIEKGRVAWAGDAAAFRADPSLKERYLGV